MLHWPPVIGSSYIPIIKARLVFLMVTPPAPWKSSQTENSRSSHWYYTKALISQWYKKLMILYKISKWIWLWNMAIQINLSYEIKTFHHRKKSSFIPLDHLKKTWHPGLLTYQTKVYSYKFNPAKIPTWRFWRKKATARIHVCHS